MKKKNGNKMKDKKKLLNRSCGNLLKQKKKEKKKER